MHHWASPSGIFSHLLQNLMLKCFHFFPLLDFYLMISESRHSWCAVSVFDIPLCSWVSAGKTKWEFATTWKLGLEPNISRKLEVSSLIDLILAMAVLFSDMTLTLRKSRVRCCGAMQFRACSSLMSATLPEKDGCETWVRRVLNWPSLRNSNMATEVHFKLR